MTTWRAKGDTNVTEGALATLVPVESADLWSRRYESGLHRGFRGLRWCLPLAAVATAGLR